MLTQRTWVWLNKYTASWYVNWNKICAFVFCVLVFCFFFKSVLDCGSNKLQNNIPCGYNLYLKFLLVERLKEMLRNKFIKTLLQSQELCLYSSHKSPVYIQPGGKKGRDDELDRIGLFTAELENAHITEELVLIHTFCTMKEMLISSFFPSTINYCTTNRKTKVQFRASSSQVLE